MKAAIISIGDEVILGENIDTNSAWLAAQLVERSIQTIEHRTVGDDRQAIAATIDALARRVDVLIITGGLGPTDDDLTRDALGDVVDPQLQLVTDDDAVNWLEDRFSRQGRAMPVMNRRQAQRPASMSLIPNPHGTAPGLRGRLGDCMLFALPGPPSEMKPMFLDHVAPTLRFDERSDVMRSGLVHAFGIGESDAAQRLGELTDRSRHPLIGTTVSGAIVTARIRAIGQLHEVQSLVEADMNNVESIWQPYAFGRGETTLPQAVGELLREAGKKLITAESCTGGLLGKMLVDVPGSTDYYLGGWVTYSNDMKTICLAVSHELLEAHGAVSQPVAQAMASGALANAEADFALAITGVAGPHGGTALKPVGTVFISLAYVYDSLINVSTRHFRFPGDRATVRDRSALAALQMLRFALLDVPESTPMLWQLPHNSAKATERAQ